MVCVRIFFFTSTYYGLLVLQSFSEATRFEKVKSMYIVHAFNITYIGLQALSFLICRFDPQVDTSIPETFRLSDYFC